MKKFVLKLFIFLLPIAIVIMFIEYSLSQIPNSYNKKKSSFEEHPDSIEVLIAGNSQNMFGVNPDYFDKKAFNISSFSQTFYYDNQIITSNLEKLKNLKLVILPVSYTSLYIVPLENSPEDWRCYYYKRFWNIPNKNLSVFNPSNFSYLTLYTWEETKKLMQKKFKVDLAENLYRNGFMKMDTAKNNLNISDTSGLNRVNLHEKIMNEKYFTSNYEPLVNLIKQLQKKKIEVVLITPPVYHTYYEYCNPAILQKNDSVIKNLCNSYGLKYYNYFKDPRLSKPDFRDNDHLNFIGAAHFSKILNEEIIKKQFAGR